MTEIKIGKVTHFFPKISVAVVELNGTLRKGDKIALIAKTGERFEQVVESMQIEKKQVTEAGSGQSIGLKVSKEPKMNSDVVKIQ
jgi:translation initiation factor IF-2